MTQSASPQLDPRVQRLIRLHRTAELASKIVVLPIANVTYVYTAWKHPCWQTFTLLASMVYMTVSWLLAFRNARAGRIETAVKLITISGTVTAALIMLLREGSGLALTVVLLALCAYTSLFSARWLIIVGVASMLSVVSRTVVGHFGWIPKFSLGGGQLAMELAFIFAFYPLAVFFMRFTQKVSDSMLREAEQSAESQSHLLATVARLQPEIDGAVRSIDTVANSIASQASQQAATSRQVSESTESLAAMVASASEAAADTKLIAEKTRDDSQAGSRKLTEVEGGFQDALRFNGAVRTDIEALAAEIVRTEEINQALRDIAEGLKMLSINAGLEAARAGEDGRGFAVIAAELRRMIEKTSEDLARSRGMLQTIRTQATVVSERAQASSAALQRHFDDLRQSTLLVQSMTEGVSTAAARVDSITEDGARQRERLAEVSLAMRSLDEAASQLAPAASELTTGMLKLVAANDDLRALLADKAAPAGQS